MGAFPHRHFAAPLSPGCRIKSSRERNKCAVTAACLPACLLHISRREYRTGKQYTHIPSNTTQVYFISIAYLYMYAACFGLYLGHLQACHYKNLTKEDVREI